MAVLRHIEPFSVTLSGAQTTNSATLTTTLLDTSKALVLYTLRHSGDQPRWSQCRYGLSATQVTFIRAAATGTVQIEGVVLEWLSGVTVERGTTTTIQPEQTIALSLITDLSKAVVIPNHSEDGGVYDGDNTVTHWLVDNGGTIELHIFANSPGISPQQTWQVMQYDACSVQRGSITTMGTGASATAAVSSVPANKSWVLFSHRTPGGQGVNQGHYMLRGVKTSPTLLTFDRSVSGVFAINDIRWQLLTFLDGTLVQEILSTFSVTDGDNTETLSPAVDLTRTVAYPTGPLSSGRTTYTANDIPGDTTFTCTFPDSTHVQIQRNSTLGTADVAVSILELDTGAGTQSTLALARTQGFALVPSGIVVDVSLTLGTIRAASMAGPLVEIGARSPTAVASDRHTPHPASRRQRTYRAATFRAWRYRASSHDVEEE
jgi:hypothetical protein